MEAGIQECGRIFVAGTGRSGTTHLASLLGAHPQIFHIPFEARFIVDAGGLEDLIDWLTVRYTPNHGDQALRVFQAFYLNRRLGDEVYRGLSELIERLTLHRHEQPVPALAPEEGGYAYRKPAPATHTRVFARYFDRRADLVDLCRRYVDQIFSAMAANQRKTFWCEKTPLNLLSLEFLWEMFPDAAVIHIKRDPRGVLQSLLKQAWAPNDPEPALHMLRAIYSRWRKVKERLDFSEKRYMEVKIEDFPDNPPERMKDLLSFIGADARVSYPNESFSRDRIEYWRQECPRDLLNLCEKNLGEFFELMGYEI